MDERKPRLCAYYQLWRIMERRQGMTYKTEVVRGEWFLMGQGPALNREDERGEFWTATSRPLEYRTDYAR